MKNKWEPRWVGILVLGALLLAACRKAAEPVRPDAGAGGAAGTQVAPEVDTEKIAAATGVRFRILKTEEIGLAPCYKFYWVAVGEEDADAKIKALAEALIRGAIAARPRTYHSFTIHFFHDRDLRGAAERSRPFARATFLPGNDWQRVGRVSIEDYAGYELACVRLATR